MLQVGIQLYSVRNHMANDWKDTLSMVADAGYSWIEPANHYIAKDDGIGFGADAESLKQLLDDTGLKVCNTHLYPMHTEEALPRLPYILEYQKAIGNSRVTCAMAFFNDTEQTKQLADLLNRYGEVCRSFGADFMYHNHYHEFQVFAGEKDTVFDTLLKYTDPDLVKFELDTYWAARGGQDVPALIRKLGPRLLMLHQKDFPSECSNTFNLIERPNAENLVIDMDYYNRDHTPESFTEVGTGILPIQSYIDAANESSAADFIILEQDFTVMDEIDSIRKSMEGFRKYNGVKW